MKKISYILLTAVIYLAACTPKAEVTKAKAIPMGKAEAAAPYLTKDHKGNAVLCWTEKDSADFLNRLKYARYDARTGQFSTAITVPASAGCSNAAESMAKVAFKADGTILAVFAKRFPNEKNPYAGAIYYSTSTDEGRTWSVAQFLHSDTAHSYGRSFFDVARLKDGELGAVWLDGRFGKRIKGSALFFARTEKERGFAKDSCIDQQTCECCRTALLTDKTGNIHLAYRSINFPSALADRQIRDLSYKLSVDNGKTFTVAKNISPDQWEINGCPHSGPSLAASNDRLAVTWFTAGGSAGLYYTVTASIDGNFRRRNLITASGRHPQLIALKDGRLAMVCEESDLVEAGQAKESKHGHGAMKMDHQSAGTAKMMLYLIKADVPEKPMELSDGKAADSHAVLTELDDGLLVAWVRAGKPGSKIYYTKVSTTE